MQVVQQPAAVELFTEIDQLKARLAEAEKRERELNDKLAARPVPAVKQEEPADSRLSPARPAVPASSQRSGASLSLLVSRLSFLRLCRGIGRKICIPSARGSRATTAAASDQARITHTC